MKKSNNISAKNNNGLKMLVWLQSNYLTKCLIIMTI